MSKGQRECTRALCSAVSLSERPAQSSQLGHSSGEVIGELGECQCPMDAEPKLFLGRESQELETSQEPGGGLSLA